MVWPVITGIHRPIAAILRVPRNRKFDNFVPRILMDKCPDVVAGPQNIVDLLLIDIRGFSIGPELMAPLEVTPLALEHCVVLVGCRVRGRASGFETVADGLRRYPGK